MRDTRRSRIVLAILVLVSITLIVFDLRGGDSGPTRPLRAAGETVLGSAERVMASFVLPVRGFLESLGGLGEVGKNMTVYEAGGEVAFDIEAGKGEVGLGLEPDGLDPARCMGGELRHPASVEEVGDKPCDEDGFPRARQARDAKADNGFEEGFADRGGGAFEAAGDPVGDGGKDHSVPLWLARNISIRLLNV